MIKLLLYLAITIPICVFFGKGIEATLGSHWWTVLLAFGGGCWIGASTGLTIKEFAR